MANYIIELRDVDKRFGEVVAVNRVSLQISRGEYVVIVGPSGSGKTTLLLMLGGFEKPSSGDIIIDGKLVNELPPAKRSTATVFQDYSLFPHMTVFKNIEFGLKMRKVKKEERRTRALDILSLVGLEGLHQRYPHELSGGQKQRVALARSLVVEPSILLLDEPLGALDAALRRQMQRELKRIQKQVGITFIHVTHDQEEAMSIADKLIVINAGEIQDEGRPDQVYQRPQSLFSAKFMGDNNLITGKIAETADDTVQIKTDFGTFRLLINKKEQSLKGLAVGSEATFTLRPENINVARREDTGENLIHNAKVTKVLFQGSYIKVIAEVPGYGELKVQFHGMARSGIREDHVISLSFESKNTFLLGIKDTNKRSGEEVASAL